MSADPIGRYLKTNPEDSQSQIALRSGLSPSVICDVRKGRRPGFTEEACRAIAADLAGKPAAPTAAELMGYRERNRSRAEMLAYQERSRRRRNTAA